MSNLITSIKLEIIRWYTEIYGFMISQDKAEQSLKLLENTFKLALSVGISKEMIIRLVDHVYNTSYPAHKNHPQVILADLLTSSIVVSQTLNIDWSETLLQQSIAIASEAQAINAGLIYRPTPSDCLMCILNLKNEHT